MDLTQEDVLQILRIMDESDYEQLHLEAGGLKLVVNKRGVSGHFHDQQGVSKEPAGLSEKAEKTIEFGTSVNTGEKTEADMTDEAYASEGLIPIRSPMLGTFYRSSKPGGAPFVEAGQVVDKETTVCIIEVMKLFSTIHAGMRGRIAKICANDGQMVEYNQALFLVEPLTDTPES